ncbi:hypothetical protein H6G96_15500 [Nostoc sp. FACHB-892]|uniref:hypothetical protein n=1 Tax=Nostoc sp. FACHB-892 TaxID=2692843 RepID=UPI001682A937|nr:hypothetical protein [Nostoc sp. FACHB-892]MBD2727693.1 hypothetical protein [Nostoc sp. FACHB-892]
MRSHTHDTQKHQTILILQDPEWKAMPTAGYAYAKAQTPYYDYEVKPVSPFLILRRPGDYA